MNQDNYEFYERLGLLFGMGWGFLAAIVILILVMGPALHRAYKSGYNRGLQEGIDAGSMQGPRSKS